jgi:hypothetical protein
MEPFGQESLLQVFQGDRSRSFSDKRLCCSRRHVDFLGKRGKVLRNGVKRFCGSSWESEELKQGVRAMLFIFILCVVAAYCANSIGRSLCSY